MQLFSITPQSNDSDVNSRFRFKIKDLQIATSWVGSSIALNSTPNSIHSPNQICEDIKDTLRRNGYKIIRIITNTLQGCIYEAQTTNEHGTIRVAIKRSDKTLSSVKKENGHTSSSADENIVREAQILRYLSNKPPMVDYVPQFIDFFQNEDDYFLVTQYCGDTNLNALTLKAHEFIKDNKLAPKDWLKTVKFLSWQLCVALYYLHEMNVCHLDISMTNVVLKNANFNINPQNGMVVIDPNIQITLVDFGCSELFRNDPSDFRCFNFDIRSNTQLKCPQIINQKIYDARKADVFSISMVIYQTFFGAAPYKVANDRFDKAYKYLKMGKFQKMLNVNRHDRLKSVYGPKLVSLLSKMMNISEKERFLITDAIQHHWFKKYFGKYHQQIEQKAMTFKSEKGKVNNQISFSFYNNQNLV